MFKWLANASIKYTILFLLGAGLVLLAILRLHNIFNNFRNGQYKIGIIINSVEIEPEDLRVTKLLVKQRLDEINNTGGIDGHLVEAIYLDDKGDHELLKKLVTESIADENLIAYIGCKSSSRALAIAPILERENVALIGAYSLTPLMEKFPNMYSGEIGIRDVEIILQSLLKEKATRGAFIGKKDDLYSEALLKIMTDQALQDPGFKVNYQKWYPLQYKFSKTELDNLADSLKKNADFLLLTTEQGSTNALLEALWARGVKMPVFCGLADIAQINRNSRFYTEGELFDVNPVGIPGVLNMRLQEQVTALKGELPPGNMLEFQVGFGGRHADEIGLIKEAASLRLLPEKAGIRSKINAGLLEYIQGKRIYQGWMADWYFTRDRAFGGEALLAWKAPGFTAPMLAPMQFLRTDTGYRRAPVLYTNLDLVNLNQVNDEEGSFYSSFYLELTSPANLKISDIDFTNAERNKINQEPLLEAKLIRSKTDSGFYKFSHYLYKVSGKFLFNPDLKSYPFDEQKFPISIQTSNALQTFLVQPPDQEFRDMIYESEGWLYNFNYVGYDQDIITIDNYFGGLQKNIPYYKFSFIYEMKRARIDFNLKTLVPLLAILIITYFSVYIPAREFEALCAIQVTALLASIALYFSTYKPEMQYATTSDKIFIFTYVMITTLIGTSVLKYALYRKNRTIKRMAVIYQRLLFPLIVIAFVAYIRWL